MLGAKVCQVHGGTARQTKAKADRVVAVWEAQQSQPATVIERRTPEQILLDLLHDGDITLSKIKGELASGGLSGGLMAAWGEWVDRMSRLSRLVIDSGIKEKADEQRAVVSRLQAQALIELLEAAFADPRVFVDPNATPSQIILDAMARLEQQQVVAA